MARCHRLEHPGQTRSKRQSTGAPWIRISAGPQRKEDKRKNPQAGTAEEEKAGRQQGPSVWNGRQRTATLGGIIRKLSRWPGVGASGAAQGGGGGKNEQAGQKRKKRTRARNRTEKEGGARREGDERTAAGPHGQEHPRGRRDKRACARNRTGASGEERTNLQQGRPDWNIRGAEAQDWSIQGRVVHSPRTGLSGGADPVPRTGRSGAKKKPHSSGVPWTGRIQEDEVAQGQAQGARTGTSGEELTGRQQGHADWSIPGGRNPGLEHPAKKRVALEWSVRGCARGRRRRRQERRENKGKERDDVEGRGKEGRGQ